LAGVLYAGTILARMLALIFQPHSKGYAMTSEARQSLHDVHTSTQDVLKGFRTMLERAEPEIRPTVQALTDLHSRHAQEQEREMHRLGESGADDTSFQGSANMAAVIVRDWVTGLDRNSLSAVRQGEEALRDRYVEAMDEMGVGAAGPTRTLLTQQHVDICNQIAKLPKS